MMFGQAPFSDVPFSTLSGPPLLNLSGVSATGSVGTLGWTKGAPLTSATGTGQAGSFSGFIYGAGLSGVQANGTAGNVVLKFWSNINTTSAPNWQPIETE